MIKEINEINLDEYGIKEIDFYYKGTKLVDNIFTSCILIGENRTLLSRGITICSPYDKHCKETGRSYSFGRALKAIKNKKNSGNINDNHLRWDGEYILRTRKLKSKDFKEFIKILQDNLIEWVTISEKKDIKTIMFKLPRLYSIIITRNMSFTWKCEYKPTPNNFEKTFYKLRDMKDGL